MTNHKTFTWARLDQGNDVGYITDGATIIDNGGGMGPSQDSGRWAVMIAGRWVANIDTLAEAKTRAAQELTS